MNSESGVQSINEIENALTTLYGEITIRKEKRIWNFSELHIQMEQWFRGELMHFPKENENNMTTENRKRTISNQGSKERKKADFFININNENYWIELKHILIGHQKNRNNNFKMDFYFNKSNPSNIMSDIEKLENVKQDTAYVLVFVSVNDNSITKKNDLEGCLDKARNKFNESAEKIAVDYDNNSNFGYFILKLKK